MARSRRGKVGGRETSEGSGWGLALGAALGILSGGVTLIGGAIAGAAGGAILGSFFHKGLGLSDADKRQLEDHLKDGGAAVVAMADADEVDAIKAELSSLGGTVEDYQVPDETVDKVEQASDVQPAKDSGFLASALTPGQGAIVFAGGGPAPGLYRDCNMAETFLE